MAVSSNLQKLLDYKNAPDSFEDTSINVSENDVMDAADMLVESYGTGEEVILQMINSGNIENIHNEFCNLAQAGPEMIDTVWELLDCSALTGVK